MPLIILKKTVTLILLFCMLIYAGGYQLIFSCYQMSLKAEIKAYLLQNPHSKFNTVFTFSANNGKICDAKMQWEENGKEFWFNGNLYDIVLIEYFPSSAKVYCINDKAESKLITQSVEILQKQNQKSSGSMAQFQKLLTSTFEISTNTIISNFFPSRKTAYLTNDTFLLSNSTEIQKPPPKSSWL